MTAITNSFKPEGELVYKIAIKDVDINILLVVLPIDKRFCMFSCCIEPITGSFCIIYPD